MRQFFIAVLLAGLTSFSAVASEGMIRVESSHSVGETADRLQGMLEAKGMTVFARVDHAAGAKKAGHSLPPKELLIFGNPKIGTPLMKCAPDIAIDLPQKALIYEDGNGQVWIAYNDPAYLKLRHQVEGCDEVLKKVSGALANFTGKAAAAE